MAEDFTTYTTSGVTATATRITWTSVDRTSTAKGYKDKGVDFFSGNFTHYIILLQGTHIAGSGDSFACWLVSNGIGSWRSHKFSGSHEFIGLGISTPTGYNTTGLLFIAEGNGAGGVQASSTYTITQNTLYYLKIVKDESVGAKGTVYCYVYSDAARTVLLTTLTRTLSYGLFDYRYLYAFDNYGHPTGGGFAHSGYTDTLELLESSPSAVTTQATTDVLPTTATGNGNITSLGSALVTEHGHCWSTSANPTTADSKTTKGAGTLGTFISLITGLSAGTTYHTRAYATNSFGTSYGADVTFIATATDSPTVTIQPLTDLTSTTATGNATITSIGASAVTQHGHCWATSVNPTTSDSKTSNGLGYFGAFTSAITDLVEGTTYYFRAYATNTEGTGYSNNIVLTSGVATARAISIVETELHYVDVYGGERGAEFPLISS